VQGGAGPSSSLDRASFHVVIADPAHLAERPVMVAEISGAAGLDGFRIE